MWYIHHTFVCIKFLFRLSRFLTFYIIQLNHLVQETEVVARKSRKKVMLNPKPCRRGENGWTNEISRLKKGIGMMQAIIIYIYIYGGCPKFFLLETAILSQKKFYFSQTFAISTKNFRAALCWDCIWECLVGNRSLTRDICASERPSKLILWQLRIHMWCVSLSTVVLLTFSGQFWHFHTETKGSPASCLSGNKT